jgi:hypothetical protein
VNWLWWLGEIIYATSLAQLGRSEEAGEIVRELARSRPGIDAAALRVLPFASANDHEHLLADLRKGGFPG